MATYLSQEQVLKSIPQNLLKIEPLNLVLLMEVSQLQQQLGISVFSLTIMMELLLKSAVAWEQSRERFVFARDADDGGGIGVDNPQLTFNSYATIEVGSIWVNDCAGQSELIACDNGERTLNNITIDAGYF